MSLVFGVWRPPRKRGTLARLAFSALHHRGVFGSGAARGRDKGSHPFFVVSRHRGCRGRPPRSRSSRGSKFAPKPPKPTPPEIHPRSSAEVAPPMAVGAVAEDGNPRLSLDGWQKADPQIEPTPAASRPQVDPRVASLCSTDVSAPMCPRNWPTLVKLRPNFRRNWTMLANIRPNSTNLGQCRPRLGRSRPNFG